MLGIEGVGFVHAAGQNWSDVRHAMAYGQSPLSTKLVDDQDVTGMFLPPLPQPKMPNGRRFSPWLRMAVQAGKACIKPTTGAAGKNVLGVIGATTMGSLQHTADFVENMIRNQEAGPQPANFILSVHNAATAQMAIALQAKGYNNTISHDETSFEQALVVANEHVKKNSDNTFIIVGADEWIPLLQSARIASGCWPAMAEAQTWIPAEGATAMLVKKSQPGQVGVKMVHLRMFSENPRVNQQKAAWIHQMMRQAGLDLSDMDMIMTLDPHEDIWRNLPDVAGKPRRLCRHWLGTFGMANAFVITSAAAMLGAGQGAPDQGCQNAKNILVYHESANHSASLVVVGR